MSPLDPFLHAPIAHRCLHDIRVGRPENSWEALEAAVAAGLPVEIDLQLSADGQAIVFHDAHMDRLTARTGRVADYAASDLQKIPLKGGQKTIPLLSDFMAHVAGRIPVLIEIKDQDGALGNAESGIEAATIAALDRYQGTVALMSFNPHIIARCAGLAPEIARGLVTDPFTETDWPDVPSDRRKELAGIPDYDAVGASFISHNAGDLTSDAVGKVKAKGGKIFCWTVRSQAQEDTVRKIADNITFEGYSPA